MRLIVITAPAPVAEEAATINALFAAGLDLLHLRKPGYSRTAIRRLATAIEPAYRSRVTLHDHHQLVGELALGGCHYPAARREEMAGWEGRLSTSCHSADEVQRLAATYDYLLLSPIFASISKPGYLAAFDRDSRQQLCRRHPNLVALGGISHRTLPELLDQGWYGAAVLGTLWSAATLRERLHEFTLLQQLITFKEGHA